MLCGSWQDWSKMFVGADGIGQKYLRELAGLGKSICGSWQDWSKVSAGVCRTRQKYLQELAGLGAGGIDQDCLW